MNWLAIVQKDYHIYQDAERIRMFVEKGKITAEQYMEITGEPYTE